MITRSIYKDFIGIDRKMMIKTMLIEIYERYDISRLII